MLEKRCIDCDKPVETYRKSNMCEKCYELFLLEEEEARVEKTRSTWFIGGKKNVESVDAITKIKLEF
jgi:hypothetical protein